MRTPGFIITALLASPLLAGAAHAGAYLESIYKDLDGPATASVSVSKMWFDSGRMRTERSEADGARQVVLFRDQAMYMLDPKTRTYRVIDKATAERMGAKMADARKQMEAQMASMPPEQRARMQAMIAQMGKGGAMGGMPGAKAPARTLKNTGRTQSVAGIKCTLWDVMEDGKKSTELCVAAAGALSGGDEIVKTLREVSTLMSSFMESFGTASAGNEPWNDMEKINGVPILTREFSGGKATAETRLSVIRKESVAGSSFNLPAGYTEQKMGFGPPEGGPAGAPGRRP